MYGAERWRDIDIAGMDPHRFVIGQSFPNKFLKKKNFPN